MLRVNKLNIFKTTINIYTFYTKNIQIYDYYPLYLPIRGRSQTKSEQKIIDYDRLQKYGIME